MKTSQGLRRLSEEGQRTDEIARSTGLTEKRHWQKVARLALWMTMTRTVGTVAARRSC